MENICDQIGSFRKLLEVDADKDRAINEKRYLKSPFKFFGVSVPITDKLAKGFRKANPNAERGYVIELADSLWHSEYHEEKRLGLRMLQLYPLYLDFAIMPMLEIMLEQSTGWDFVDAISIHLVGRVLERTKRSISI